MDEEILEIMKNKRYRSGGASEGLSSAPALLKNFKTLQAISPLKILPPCTKVVETSGTAAAKSHVTSPHLVESPKSQPYEQADHLIPYYNEYARLVKKKNIDDGEGCALPNLVNTLQLGAYKLSTIASYYEERIA